MAMSSGVTAAYMTIENRGGGADRLISVSTEVAAEAEIHQTQISETDIAQMIRQTDGVPILPNSALNIAPGGYHIMLSGLTGSLKSGQSVVLRLTFASGTTLETLAIVSDLPPDAQ
jgi:copper(I)-binding protein